MLTVEGICTEQNDSLSSCMRKSKHFTKLLYSIHIERHAKPTSELTWETIFSNSTSIQWRNIYTSTFRTIGDVTLRNIYTSTFRTIGDVTLRNIYTSTFRTIGVVTLRVPQYKTYGID